MLYCMQVGAVRQYYSDLAASDAPVMGEWNPDDSAEGEEAVHAVHAANDRCAELGTVIMGNGDPDGLLPGMDEEASICHDSSAGAAEEVGEPMACPVQHQPRADPVMPSPSKTMADGGSTSPDGTGSADDESRVDTSPARTGHATPNGTAKNGDESQAATSPARAGSTSPGGTTSAGNESQEVTSPAFLYASITLRSSASGLSASSSACCSTASPSCVEPGMAVVVEPAAAIVTMQ